jgi:hypothetical protein
MEIITLLGVYKTPKISFYSLKRNFIPAFALKISAFKLKFATRIKWNAIVFLARENIYNLF